MKSAQEKMYLERKKEICQRNSAAEEKGLKHLFKYDYKNEYEYYSDILSEEEFKKMKQGLRKKAKKRKNCNVMINELLQINALYDDSKIVFGTCTFSDNQLFKKNGKPIKEETRTKKVNKWLNSHFLISVANIDYGTKNEREHHHFVALTREEIEPKNKKGKSGFDIYELKNKDYTLGFEPTLELVKPTKKVMMIFEDKYTGQEFEKEVEIIDDRRLSNYLTKINYHSNKKTTKNRRVRLFYDIAKI